MLIFSPEWQKYKQNILKSLVSAEASGANAVEGILQGMGA